MPFKISGKLFADIAAYIDDRYVDEHTDSREEQRRRRNLSVAGLYSEKAPEARSASWRSSEASKETGSMVAESGPAACIREAAEAPESEMVAEPGPDTCIREASAEPELPTATPEAGVF